VFKALGSPRLFLKRQRMKLKI